MSTRKTPTPKPARPDHRTPFGTGTQKASAGNGGLKMVEKGMQNAAGVTCVECPFRKDSAPGYLGGYTPEMYLEIAHSPASVACHIGRAFEEGDVEHQRHCSGLSHYRANVGHICGGAGRPTHAHNSTQLCGPADHVFGSPEEFYEHHAPAQRRSRG